MTSDMKALDQKALELLPCPFCGGEAEATNYAIEAAVRCRCGAAITKPHNTYDDAGYPAAIEAWNRRLAVAEAVEPVGFRELLTAAREWVELGPDLPGVDPTDEHEARELLGKIDAALASPPPASSPKVSEVIEACAKAAEAYNEEHGDPADTIHHGRSMIAAIRALSPDIQGDGALISHRMEEAGFVEFLNEDVPTIVRDIQEKVAIHLDLNTRKVVGYRVYDPASPSLTGEE